MAKSVQFWFVKIRQEMQTGTWWNKIFMCNLFYLNGKAIGHYRCIQGQQIDTILQEGSLDIFYKIFTREWALMLRTE